MFPSISQWGHRSHMTQDIVNVPAISWAGELQGNLPGKFWMYLGCTGSAHAQYIFHFLAVSLQCTGSVHCPLSPVDLAGPSRSSLSCPRRRALGPWTCSKLNCSIICDGGGSGTGEDLSVRPIIRRACWRTSAFVIQHFSMSCSEDKGRSGNEASPSIPDRFSFWTAEAGEAGAVYRGYPVHCRGEED